MIIQFSISENHCSMKETFYMHLSKYLTVINLNKVHVYGSKFHLKNLFVCLFKRIKYQVIVNCLRTTHTTGKGPRTTKQCVTVSVYFFWFHFFALSIAIFQSHCLLIIFISSSQPQLLHGQSPVVILHRITLPQIFLYFLPQGNM